MDKHPRSELPLATAHPAHCRVSQAVASKTSLPQWKDLMLAGPDLQNVDRGAFAQVLHDLAIRPERATGELQHASVRPRMTEEARP